MDAYALAMDRPVDYVLELNKDGEVEVWRQCDECNEPVMSYDDPAASASRVLCDLCERGE